MDTGFRAPLRGLVVAAALTGALAAQTPVPTAQDPSQAGTLTLLDRHGNAVPVATDTLHPSLRPPQKVDAQHQIPTPVRGAPLTDDAMRKIAAGSAERGEFGWFPATPPELPPYLGGLDDFGNTALAPGALIAHDPLSALAQSVKYDLSSVGLRYTWYQGFTLLSMSDTVQGERTLEYYTGSFTGKWAVYDAPASGTAGWVSTEIDLQLGLDSASRSQLPQENLGSIVLPLASSYGPNGIWIAELAWQQSFASGELVVLAGVIDQSNYIDENAYANYPWGQFQNSALVNSMVLPLPFNDLGFNVQWQPSESWYLVYGSGANYQEPGAPAFQHLSFDNWSHQLELGFTPKDVLGLGPGTYRIQPFVATVDGVTQAGIGLNVGQKLGKDSPWAYFGRFGVGGSAVTVDGAKAQIGTGFTMQGPLEHLGLAPRLSNDFFGTGFFWSQPSEMFGPAFHDDEYGFETAYVLQLTPTATIQPDVQVIWNPAGNPESGAVVVAQLQVSLSW